MSFASHAGQEAVQKTCCHVWNPIWSSLQSSCVTHLDAGCSHACPVIRCNCQVCLGIVSTAHHAASSKHPVYVLLDGHDQPMLSLSLATCLCSSHVMNGHVSLPAVGRAKQKASGRGWGHARFSPPAACQQKCPQVTSFPRGDCVPGLLPVLPARAKRPSSSWPQLKEALFWLPFCLCAAVAC